MANLTITDLDLGGVIVEGHADTDGILVNAALTEETFEAGTILGRDSVTGKFAPYDPALTPPADLLIPKAVLTYPVTLAAAAETAVRVFTNGKVNQNRLLIHGGGTINHVQLDALRDYGIVPLDVAQLARDDNPQA